MLTTTFRVERSAGRAKKNERSFVFWRNCRQRKKKIGVPKDDAGASPRFSNSRASKSSPPRRVRESERARERNEKGGAAGGAGGGEVRSRSISRRPAARRRRSSRRARRPPPTISDAVRGLNDSRSSLRPVSHPPPFLPPSLQQPGEARFALSRRVTSPRATRRLRNHVYTLVRMYICSGYILRKLTCINGGGGDDDGGAVSSVDLSAVGRFPDVGRFPSRTPPTATTTRASRRSVDEWRRGGASSRAPPSSMIRLRRRCAEWEHAAHKQYTHTHTTLACARDTEIALNLFQVQGTSLSLSAAPLSLLREKRTGRKEARARAIFTVSREMHKRRARNATE